MTHEDSTVRVVRTYRVCEVAPYINWIYFYHAWQVKQGKESESLRADADRMLQALDTKYCTHAVVVLTEACSEHDDIVVADGTHIPCLRQQVPGADGACLSMADFLAPAGIPSGDAADLAHRMGLFATTVDAAMETDLRADAYERMLSQTLADRLAEATAEVLHMEVRRSLWGYAPQEQSDIRQLLEGRYQGIRPAVGYPSLPDTSVNFILERLLRMSDIGIRLTESGAMRPHASVSGLMLAHPVARYFNLGRIDETQLADYARRRGLPVQLVRRFLAASLVD